MLKNCQGMWVSRLSAFIYASSHADEIVMMIVDNELIGSII